MCLVPAGTFMMGCNEAVDNECDPWVPTWVPNEKPYHEVNLDAFEIDKYEVTAGEFKACVDARGCTAADTDQDCTYGVSGQESHPINCVDWNEAKAYCEWAGKRLPTEAEWDKAARGTDGRKYPWGNDYVDCDHAVQTATDCSISCTAPVGSKPAGASPYGAEDMVGNVWEWVEDCWHSSYSGAPSTGEVWSGGDCTHRVLRGGGWNTGASYLRASSRVSSDPLNRIPWDGFRCAR
jgi:formylglycine-generating enzyme required for sulfatase activity